MSAKPDKRRRGPCTECGKRIIDGPTNNGTSCMECMGFGNDVSAFRDLWLLSVSEEYEKRFGPPPIPPPVTPQTFFLNEQHEVNDDGS